MNDIAKGRSGQLPIRNARGDVVHEVSMEVATEFWCESMVWSGAERARGLERSRFKWFLDLPTFRRLSATSVFQARWKYPSHVIWG